MTVSPSEFLRLLVDPVRLAVIGAAAVGAVEPDELAATLDVRQRDVLEALGKLRAAGLIDDEGVLDRSELRQLAAELPRQASVAEEIVADGDWTASEAEVLARFFSGSRLSSIPSHLNKRRVVLERLVQEFEPGVRYAEAQVNFTLQLFHADFAALRRYLVDEGFMARADGVYWRTGGRYPVAG